MTSDRAEDREKAQPTVAVDGTGLYARVWTASKKNMRRNAIPGFVIIAIAVLLIVLYYNAASVQSGFDSLADLKSRGGYLFSFISTMIFAGIIPSIVAFTRDSWVKMDPSTLVPDAELLQRCPDARPLTGRAYQFACYLFYCAFWGVKGIEVDAFYRLQSLMFGSGTDIRTVVAKCAFDELVYTVFWSTHEQSFIYFWKESFFSFRLARTSFTWSLYMFKFLSMLLASWMVWVPAVCVIYAFPSSLQLVLFNIVDSFWSILLTLFGENTKAPVQVAPSRSGSTVDAGAASLSPKASVPLIVLAPDSKARANLELEASVP